jgi:GNAT superfamily N-acetyltransferase
MNASYRSLDADEVGEAADVFLVGLADLVRRFGLPEPHFTREMMIPVYAHLQRTGIFDVAEADGRIVSICAAIVRDDAWFLSMFWTRPEFQRRGIGRPLLERVWKRGLESGATKQFVWSSVDPTAIATYMRKGMLPGGPVLTFAGIPEGSAGPVEGYAAAEWEPSAAEALDRAVRGAARPVDHEFWGDGSTVRRTVTRGAERVGYFCAHAGAIGPAAWSADAHSSAVLSLALAAARKQSAWIRIAALGHNHAAIRFALAHKLKLMVAGHVLMTEPIAAFERYVPSGPALFWCHARTARCALARLRSEGGFSRRRCRLGFRSARLLPRHRARLARQHQRQHVRNADVHRVELGVDLADEPERDDARALDEEPSLRIGDRSHQLP